MNTTRSKPIQKRALLTREKILDGLEALLARHEFEAISIADIAREAGVAVGSVYSHYKDKEALLPALLDRQLERVKARLAELRETGTLDGFGLDGPQRPDMRSLIRFSLENALKQIDASLGVRRALFTYRRMNPDLDIPLARALADQAFESLVTQLEDYRDEIVHTDLRAAARMVNYFVNIVFLDRIVLVKSPLQDTLRPDDETLIQTYTDMVYTYLTID
ncbi:MAG: TetR/AcrR family transcriptional regulator [Pseudomonadota bacterium]